MLGNVDFIQKAAKVGRARPDKVLILAGARQLSSSSFCMAATRGSQYGAHEHHGNHQVFLENEQGQLGVLWLSWCHTDSRFM